MSEIEISISLREPPKGINKVVYLYNGVLAINFKGKMCDLKENTGCKTNLSKNKSITESETELRP